MLGIGEFEIVPRIFLLGLQEDVAIADLLVALAAVEVQLIDVVDALHIHGEALEAVGEFAGDRRAFEACDLLEIGELRHLHAVAPAFPAEAPGAERRALPVVLDEAHVVKLHVEADGGERLQVEVLQVGRRRLDDDLELVIVLEPVGVLAVAAVLRPARRLDIGGLPRTRPERAERRRRMKRAGAHLDVIGLQDGAAVVRPIALKRQDQALERALRAHVRGQVFGHRSTILSGSSAARRAARHLLNAASRRSSEGAAGPQPLGSR